MTLSKKVNLIDQQEAPVDEGDQQRENLFLLLKRAIKARGYTYSKLAQAMNMSELSIKRLFKEKDCKMSRLLEICRIIGLSIDELVNMQQRFKDTPEHLSEEVEVALAADKHLFLFFILLVSKIDLASAQESLGFSRTEMYLQLRKLENLELIRLLGDDKYRFIVSLPIRWRINGALSKRIKTINQSYIAHCLDNEDHPDYVFSTSSRLMTENSTQQIQKSLNKVREEYDYLSTQDQMFYPRGELQLTKLVFAMGPFPIDVILTDK
ncbi:transcriptional regulator, XRE family [gamma proteobacterium IMCC1989]|nr:transcriptional regulator, XRE family [gamma proteobacterium IMCC1989]